MAIRISMCQTQDSVLVYFIDKIRSRVFLLDIVRIVVYALEIQANQKRLERGEAPKRHHDITDWHDPVAVIDRTRRY